MIRPGPLARPSTKLSMRDSIRPMKKVNASRTGTPAAEFLVFSIANMKANAPPRKTIALMPAPSVAIAPVRDADPGAEHRRQHRQREQPVGIAQNPVALVDAADFADITATDRLQSLSHSTSEGLTETDNRD